MSEKKRLRVRIRRWREEDIPALTELQRVVYSDFPQRDILEERHFRSQLEAFPEGQVLAEYRGEIIGLAACLIIQMDDTTPWHSYAEITGDGTFSTHDPSGDTLYGADICVHPKYRGRGVASRLYEERKRILKRFNLRRMVAGGRIPGYRPYAGRLTAEEYVELVKNGELTDPALNAHLSVGYDVLGVHFDYMPDEASMNYATYLEMPNPDYKPERRKIAASPISKPVRHIRVCAVQYEMRSIRSWEEFEHQVQFFVSTADEYHCHFLCFPELFTAQIVSMLDPDLDSITAIKRLSTFTGRYIEMFRNIAQKYGFYIIGGSHPVERDGKLYNVAHLFSPAGNVYTQDKLHMTPTERQEWGLNPGFGIKVFETEYARIAIPVCYDIEFPELQRLVTYAGAEVLFVPFSTDEKKAYLRVRYCAQARAVENWVFVVMAGNVGNLPQMRSFLINYGQAAIFTPSDFAFPPYATAAEAEFNTEMVAITDLDLGALALHREVGSVRPLRERRLDLYSIHTNEPVQVIRTR